MLGLTVNVPAILLQFLHEACGAVHNSINNGKLVMTEIYICENILNLHYSVSLTTSVVSYLLTQMQFLSCCEEKSFKKNHFC